jgi:sodium-coupled neutral amino acid transporter 10
MPSPKAADTPPELEMRSMAVSGGQSPARERTLGSNNVGSIRYTSGGREHVYGGPSGSGTDLCSCVLSWCSVCGLTPTERQLWYPGLMGPIINLVKVNVGGGILAIPLTFRLCGAIPATLMLVFFASLSHYSSVLLARVAEMTATKTLEGAALRLLGPRGALALQISMLLKCFGSLVAYLIVMGNVFPQLICNHLYAGAQSDPDSGARMLASKTLKVPLQAVDAKPVAVDDCIIGGVDARTATILMIMAAVLMPLSLLRSVNALRFGSALCLVMVFSLILIMIFQAVLHPHPWDHGPDGGLVEESSWAGWMSGLGPDDPVEGFLRSLGILVFAFTAQHLVFPINAELTTRDGQKGGGSMVFSLVSRVTYVTVCIAYWLMGYSGFTSFGITVRADVLQNLGAEEGGGGALITLLKVGFVSTLVFSYQFNIFAARPALDALLFEARGKDDPYPDHIFNLEGWGLVLFSAVLALVVPDLVS